MFRSNTLLIFLFIQISLFGQYEIVKYDFSDDFETDKTFISFENQLNLLIKEVNILRDTIIHTQKVPEQDKLFALQLVKMLYSDPEEVLNTMIKNDDLFPWFQYKPRKEVEWLVREFSSYYYYCDLIKESYKEPKSNIFVQHMKGDIKHVKSIIKSLGLHKNKERQSIWLRNQINDLGFDKVLQNKDVYFTTYFYSILDKWAWSHQIYADKRLGKRGNEYFNIMRNDSFPTTNETFDYIIEAFPKFSLESYDRDLALLNKGGRLYVEIDYLTKEEYIERFKEVEPSNNKYGILNKQFPFPDFTKDSLKEFVSKHGLQIEKEEKDGDLVKYLLKKM